ncbi:MAG: hypothetical protein HDS25_01125 [Bacteroides sp.]|nr:hypothetical protein [Bacteroides sp.]MBD5294908.1 hypothetical protein [Bacteroides sp.]
MTEEEFEKELDDLVGMLRTLRLIRDSGRRRIFKAEIRIQLNRAMKD